MGSEIAVRGYSEFWRSLTSDEIQTITDLSSIDGRLKFCWKLQERLFAQPNEYLDQVAKTLGSSEQFFVTQCYPPLGRLYAIGLSVNPEDNCITMGQELAYMLNGRTSAFTVQSGLGALAHEVAHRILKHREREIALALELKGFPVESLNDVIEAVKLGCKEPSLINDYPDEWLKDYVPEAVKSGSEEPSKKMAKRICRYDFPAKIPIIIQKQSDFYRNQEREADLLTMRDPYLARGLRDFLATAIAYCERTQGDCSLLYVDSDAHPSLISRIQYMTQALCEEYPEGNSDICPNIDMRNRSNSMCPTVNLSYK